MKPRVSTRKEKERGDVIYCSSYSSQVLCVYKFDVFQNSFFCLRCVMKYICLYCSLERNLGKNGEGVLFIPQVRSIHKQNYAMEYCLDQK